MEANVAVGFISDDKIDSEFVSSLLALLAQRASHIRGRCIQIRGFAGRLDIGRHTVVKVFMDNTDADYLLMVDADMVFTVKDYDEMLRSMQAASGDVVMSGVYAREDGQMCVFDWTEEGGYTPATPGSLAAKRFYEPAAFGLGFTMVSRAGLEEIARVYKDYSLPWFDMTETGPGNTRMADDTSFCFRAQDTGLQLYANTQVQVGHVKSVIAYPRVESQLTTPEKKLVVP